MIQFRLKESARDRLLYLMQKFKFDTDYGMGRATGISRSTIKGCLERDSIGPKTARRIAEALQISYKWVKMGEGPMELPGNVQDVRAKRGSYLSDDFVVVPKAAARLPDGGGLVPETDQPQERHVFSRDWLIQIGSAPDKVIVVEMDGDSMSPTLEHGDRLLIDLTRIQIGAGGIFAIGVSDVPQIKRLEPLPKGQFRVISDNAVYSDYKVDREEIRVLGKVVWSCHTWE